MVCRGVGDNFEGVGESLGGAENLPESEIRQEMVGRPTQLEPGTEGLLGVVARKLLARQAGHVVVLWACSSDLGPPPAPVAVGVTARVEGQCHH